MRQFDVTGIVYDFDGIPDGEIPALPTCMVIECEDEDGVVDAISDETGFLVKGVGSINEL